MEDKAIVRQEVEKLPYVSRSWFEYTLAAEARAAWKKILVVEISDATDPNQLGRHPLEEIAEAVQKVLTEATTMAVHELRVMPDRAAT